MASQGNSPNVSGPLASMFTGEVLAAISAEESVDKLAQQQIDIEQRATAAASATAAAATAAEVEATASALLGSVGLPDQHEVPPVGEVKRCAWRKPELGRKSVYSLRTKHLGHINAHDNRRENTAINLVERAHCLIGVIV